MRVLLMHNPTAGGNGPSARDLMRALQSEGYDPTYRSTKEAYGGTLAAPWDLGVGAGGAGAVAEIAAALSGRELPLAILPIGTANNLAVSLEISGSVPEILRGLRCPLVRRLRSATARGPWGARTVWEGVGVGLFPRLIRLAAERPEDLRPGPGGELHGALRLWANGLADYRPIPISARVDDERIEGDFLMAEVPFVRLIGPNLPLASGADPGDGWLQLVLVREGERADLLDYLNARLGGAHGSAPPSLTTLRGSSVQIRWSRSAVRLDDELWPDAESNEDVSGVMTIEAGGPVQEVWVPGSRG